jgi:Rieske Fe-S protein
MLLGGIGLRVPSTDLEGGSFVFTDVRPGPGETVWWRHLAGRPVRPEDLPVWQGATAVWRGRSEDGALVLGTGMPALVLPEEAFQVPASFASGILRLPPSGSSPASVVAALHNRCTHLCCYPGWQLKPVPEAFRHYLTAPRSEAYGRDPIWCLCHNAMYDPITFVEDSHEGIRYTGARHVHGPATRALPAIPVRRGGGELLIGDYAHPVWYNSCCR